MCYKSIFVVKLPIFTLLNMEKQYKTFLELGISFQQTTDCLTCDGLSCHNNVIHTNGKEYNVHISTDEDETFFNIQANLSSSISSKFDIEEHNLSEMQAVKYICDKFNWFKCA